MNGMPAIGPSPGRCEDDRTAPGTDRRRQAPLLLFGAFDRHNFGDLLLPHVAAALLPGRPRWPVALAASDLRACGGHRTRALAPLLQALSPGGRPAALLQVGGEVLSCSAWQAAAMLLPPAQAAATIAYLEARPAERQRWVRATLGLDDEAPYAVAHRAALSPLVYLGVGGVALDQAPAPLRTEVLAKLRAADAVSVRDRVTLGHLQRAGIAATLMPDPASLVAELFGPRLARRAGRGEPAALRAALPQGYLAVQCSADYGDDATLDRLAAQLGRAARAAGLGLALFRAGAAPWHDDLGTLQRLAARLRHLPLRLFESLDLWDIGALIAASRGYCGSSLHGRIVAMACALPRLNLRHERADPARDKASIYAATWDDAGGPLSTRPAELAEALAAALAVAPARRHDNARRLAADARRGFAATCAVLRG